MKKIQLAACLAALFLTTTAPAQIFNNGLDIHIGTGLTVNLGADFVNSEGTLLHAGTLRLRNFTNQPDALLDGGGEFVVRGNWLNYGDLLYEGDLLFEDKGTALLRTNGSGLNRIRLDKTGPAPAVELLDDLRLTEELDFKGANNKLFLSDFVLEIEPAAGITGAGRTRFVVTNGTGMLRRRLMPTGIYHVFPIGATPDTYNPLDIRNTGQNDDIAARCLPFARSGGGSGSELTADVVAASWQLDEGMPGGSNLTIYPQWTAADEFPSFERSLCAVRRHNGAGWAASPQGYAAATGGNPYKRGRAQVFDVGYFAVFDVVLKPGPPPISERGIEAPAAAGPDIKIRAWPNPFAGHFWLEKTAAPAAESRVTLQTAAGQTLRSLVWPSDWAMLDVGAGGLAPGVYFVSVDFGQGLGRSVFSVVKI